MKPLVSILIPAFNAGGFLERTLVSVVGQRYSRVEIVAIDDGSTDDTLGTLRKYEKYLTWRSQPNAGQAVTRNRLLTLSRGEYLLFLDADDIIAPDKIVRQVEKLEQEPDADLCLDDMRLFYSSIDEVDKIFPCPIDRDPWVALIATAYPFTSAGLWRRSGLEALGGWQEGIVTGHEYNRYFELLKRGRKICFTTGGRTYYRMPSKEKPNLRGADVTLREKMAFLASVEAHLSTENAITDERRAALALARLQAARRAWQFDHGLAIEISRMVPARNIALSQAAPATPAAFLHAYKIFGFQLAEQIANLKRALFNGGAS